MLSGPDARLGGRALQVGMAETAKLTDNNQKSKRNTNKRQRATAMTCTHQS